MPLALALDEESQKTKKSAGKSRKFDLDKISINQDFNTQFVKAVLYGDSEKSVQRRRNQTSFCYKVGGTSYYEGEIHLPIFKDKT